LAGLPSCARGLFAGAALLGLLSSSVPPWAQEKPRPPFTGVRGVVVEDLEAGGSGAFPSDEHPAKVRLTKTRFPSGRDSVAVDLYEPADAGIHPAVVVLHGTHGPRRGEAYYLAMSEDLARHGYVALFVRYYDRGRKNRSRGNRSLWDATIGDALNWAVTLPSVDPDRLGLVGYSQGAFLSLNFAPRDPRVKAIAAFYGGLSPGFFPAAREHMPPTFILHGTADRIVPVRRALETFQWLRDSGKPVDLVIYPTVGHGFTLHERGGWDEVAGADAWDRTLRFLDYQLKASGWRPETPAPSPVSPPVVGPAAPPPPPMPSANLPPLDFALGLAPSPPDETNPLALPPLVTVPYLGAPRSEKGRDFVLVNPDPSTIRALAAKHAPTRKRSTGKGTTHRSQAAPKTPVPKGAGSKAPAPAKPAAPKPAAPKPAPPKPAAPAKAPAPKKP